jgi:hypothetical protein
MAEGSASTDKIIWNTSTAYRLIIDKDGLTTVTSVVATTADIKEGTIDATVPILEQRQLALGQLQHCHSQHPFH